MLTNKHLAIVVTFAMISGCSNEQNRPPIFSTPTNIDTPENQTLVTQIEAKDPNGDAVIYSISGDDSENFTIEQTGRLSFITPPDFESRDSYQLVVIASDAKLASMINLKINILNENDNYPEFKSPTEFFIPHNQLDIGIIEAEDLDGDRLTYSIEQPSALSINNLTGELSFNETPDFSEMEKYRATVTVDDGANSVSQDLVVYQKLLPIISIDTFGSEIEDEPKVFSFLELMDENTLMESHYIGIEIRGSGSQLYAKKSYGFETRDSDNEDISVPLAGLPEEEDWILYGPYVDKSLIRNVLIYAISQDIGRYAARSRFTELVINHANLGTYVLMEKLKRDSNRISIKKNKSDDITGGYIIKIDKPTGDGGEFTDENSFKSDFLTLGNENPTPIHFLYEYPKSRDITQEQKIFIKQYISDFENSLFSESFHESTRAYEDYINVDSFIDFFLLTELANNVDGYRISTFLHKDRGEKLNMGPIWDFNIAFGKADSCNGDRTDTWAYRFNEVCPWADLKVPFWWEKLLEDPVYVARLKERWNELKNSHFSYLSIEAKIDNLISTLDENNALNRNFEVWTDTDPHGHLVFDSHLEEIEYLKRWTADRLSWMDKHINEL